MKKDKELGLEFPVVLKEKKPTLKGFFTWLFYKVYFMLPVRKKELYMYLSYTSQLIKAVKELESINRKQITGLFYSFGELEKTHNTNKDDKENTNYRGQYQ